MEPALEAAKSAVGAVNKQALDEPLGRAKCSDALNPKTPKTPKPL